MTEEQLRTRLVSLSEPDFQRFSAALIPTIAPTKLLGVRLPALRKLALELSCADWRAYLRDASDGSFEEIMLQGMVIGCAKATPDECFVHVADFVPKIDNWSICDSFCAGLKLAKSEPDAVWNFVQPYLREEREYFARFGVVMLLFYFIDETHIGEVLFLLGGVSADGLYAKKAAAWALSACYARFSAQTADALASDSLDEFTRKLAFQKIAESHAVSSADKAAALLLAKQRPSAGTKG